VIYILYHLIQIPHCDIDSLGQSGAEKAQNQKFWNF
jgi:hypothetical protein